MILARRRKATRFPAVSLIPPIAGVRIPAHDRMRLERLARYAGRPPLATERLSLLPDGRLLYRLKRRWRDGTSHVIFEPGELVEKLAALVPPPRVNLVRYHGILAPSAAWRPLVVPGSQACDASTHRDCPAARAEAVNAKKKGNCRPRNHSWAQLLRRVFELDILKCPRCGGRMRILAARNRREGLPRPHQNRWGSFTQLEIPIHRIGFVGD